MKTVIINENQTYIASRVVKKDNFLYLYDVQDGDGGIINTLKFPALDQLKVALEDGAVFDLSEEDEKALYDVNLDFRISLLEMGVNINDL